MAEIYKSGEDYLECILVLTNRNGSVHSVEVATALGVTKPSVSRAMSTLRQKGYIVFEADSAIKLTEKGYDVASKILERHEILTEFFMGLGVDKPVAQNDACEIEHVISEDSFAQIKSLVLEKRLQK